MRSQLYRASPVKPTTEQKVIVEAGRKGSGLRVFAFAGAGKTTSLRMYAEAASSRSRGIYVAYNRSIAHEAQRIFPSNVDCRT